MHLVHFGKLYLWKNMKVCEEIEKHVFYYYRVLVFSENFYGGLYAFPWKCGKAFILKRESQVDTKNTWYKDTWIVGDESLGQIHLFFKLIRIQPCELISLTFHPIENVVQLIEHGDNTES